jgi:uridine phosphorylase
LTAHLRPTAPIAADVLLPSDPGAALMLAQELLAKPLMANHHHGLWGYSGRTATGLELTIQSTGIGGPSTAAVLTELAGHGARRAIRLGRAVGLDPGLEPGRLLHVKAALARDGTSAALGGTEPRPDPGLGAALAAALGDRAIATVVASSDLFHDPEAPARRAAWRAAGAAVADLESAAVMAAGAQLGIAVACGLVVAESAAGEHLEEAVGRGLSQLASAGAAAFAAGGGRVQASEPGAASLL